jgi:hypothetical protein
MNKVIKLVILQLSFLISASLYAQDTLPKFSARHIGNNRVIIGWVNPFTTISQISIQRSFDSLKNFKTILTVADPKALQNGFADTKAVNDHMFYRIFYAMEGGNFFFTESKKPVQDTAAKSGSTIIGDKRLDTSGKKTETTVIKKPVFTPSFYVYTNKQGYVFINLPDAEYKKYNLKFFEEDNAFLFDIKTIKDRAITLDKSNFYKAGWYFFELYDDEKLVERHKFYLSKDF